MSVHEETVFFFNIMLHHITKHRFTSHYKKVQNKYIDNRIDHLEILFTQKHW